MKNNFVNQFFKVLSSNLLAQGIGFIIIIIISRYISVSDFGIYNTWIAIYYIILQIMDFGLGNAYIKFGSDVYTRDFKCYKTFFNVILILRIFISIVFSILLICFNYLFSIVENNIIIVISFATILSSIYNHITYHYTTMTKFSKYSLMTILNQAIRLLGMVIMFIVAYFASSNISVYSFFYNYVFSIVIVVIIWCIYNRQYVSLKFMLSNDIKKMLKMAVMNFIASIAVIMLLRSDVLFLNYLANSEEVGFFSIAKQLAMIFPIISNSITSTMLPQVSSYIKDKNLKIYVYKVIKIGIKAIPLLIMLEIISPFIFEILWNHVYDSSIIIFQVLIFSYFISLFINPINLIFYHIEKVCYLTVMNWLQLIIFCLIAIILIPCFGALGCALSWLIITVFGMIYATIILIYINKNM